MSGRLQEIFEHAVGLQGPARDEYLSSACGTDEDLRAEVVALLRVHDRTPRFLASPTEVAGVAATMFATPGEHEGQVIGRYKLLQLIGEGGFGSVFMAQQEEPVSRRVALKIIKLGMDTRAVIARFEAERQALAMMDHPNIARVLDAGATDTGRPYFVMELCKGEAIVEYCDKNNLSIQERLELFAQVCQAVQHAHTKGIIHRDIKPSNILVSMQDGRPRAKVIDFGIAKATASKLTEKTLFTEHRALIGTPEYMSPEQAEGSLDIDTRTDVYSLGVLLYELLTGTTPFSGKELRSAAYAEIQRIIREVEPPKPSTRISQSTDTLASVAAHRDTEPKRLGTTVRGELDWIVMMALEKDRGRRYETASGLAMDVRRYLAGEAVLAAPPSTAYRLRKFVRRNRVQVAAAGMVGAALLLGMAGTAWQAKVASDRAVVAKNAEDAAKVARDAEKLRADELEQVSDFQKKMLAQVDATAAGQRLKEDVNRRYAAALGKEKVPDDERADLERAFRQSWSKVNTTDAAAALIDTTILQPAVKAIDEQFKDQPILDAQLRQVLADRYVGLGLFAASRPLQESVLATRRRELGEEHPHTIAAIINLAYLLNSQGKYSEVEPLVREALDKNRRVLGEEDPNTLVSLNNLGRVLQVQGKLEEAESCLRDALEKCRRALGEEDKVTIGSIANLATVLLHARKPAEAEPLYREALEKKRRVYGEEHPTTIYALSEMSSLLRGQGRLAESESCLREVLEKRRRVLGEEHPDTLFSANDLMALLQEQGKLAEAESLGREVLEKTRRVLGEDHPDTIRCLNNMGTLFEKKGQFVESERYHREGLERIRRVLGEENPGTIDAFNKVGRGLQRQGKVAESEPVLAEGVGACRRAFAGPHPMTAMLLHHHADALRAVGRLDDAATEARQAMKMYSDHPNWSANEALHTVLILKSILTAQEKPDDAVAVGRDWLAVQRKTLPPASLALGDQLAAFGLELLMRGTLDAAREAEPLVRECLEIRIKAMPDDWRASNTQSMLGGIILLIAELDSRLTPPERAARLREAEGPLLDGYQGMKEHEASIPATAKVRVTQALERVMRLYKAWDKAEPGKGYDTKAAEWKAKLDAAPSTANQK